MIRRAFVAAFLIGTVGAGQSDAVKDPGECPGACASPVHYTLDPQFNADERVLIEQAMRVWEMGTRGRVCFVPGGRDLVIEKLDRAEELQPWDPEWPHHVALARAGRIWIVGAAVDDPGEFRGLAVHELGHHLGIGHIEDAALTYMHSTINDTPVDLWRHARLPERDAREYCKVHRCTCSYD